MSVGRQTHQFHFLQYKPLYIIFTVSELIRSATGSWCQVGLQWRHFVLASKEQHRISCFFNQQVSILCISLLLYFSPSLVQHHGSVFCIHWARFMHWPSSDNTVCYLHCTVSVLAILLSACLWYFEQIKCTSISSVNNLDAFCGSFRMSAWSKYIMHFSEISADCILSIMLPFSPKILNVYPNCAFLTIIKRR